MHVPAMIAFLLALLLAPAAWAAELMTPAEARKAALAGQVVLIDIRTQAEWARTGVPDAAHALNMRSQDFMSELTRLMDANPGTPLALICARGGRSSSLAAAWAERDISAFNVREGMLGSGDGPGWLARALPVRRPDAPRAE
ncbi:MAG: rhodanese-like domain-containing protein [Pseudomonadota bacterium]